MLKQIVPTSFIVGCIFNLTASFYFTTQHTATDFILVPAIAGWLVFVVTAIYEIAASKTIVRTEKVMWTIGLVFMSSLTGFFYLLISRKRIADHS